MEDCVFCKIVSKEVPSEIVLETGRIMAFKDIHPKAPVHLLIVPKKHIGSVADLTEEDKGLIAEIIFSAKNLAKEQSISGYKLFFNVGKDGGQVVEHLHMHLLSGGPAELP